MRQNMRDIIIHLNDIARERESRPCSAKNIRKIARKLQRGSASDGDVKLAAAIITTNQTEQ